MTSWLTSPNWLAGLIVGGLVFGLLEGIGYAIRRKTSKRRLPSLYRLWVLALATTLGLRVASAHESAGQIFRASAAISLVLGTFVAFAIADGLFTLRRRDGQPVPKIARDILKICAVVTAGLFAAQLIYKVEISTLLVSSTVLSAILGLALQDVLKNIFAGLSLDLERPFQAGDWILIDGIEPTEVLEMGWRSTRLRNRDGVESWEPNANLSTERLINQGRGDRPIAFVFNVGLPYDAPPAKAKASLLKAVRSASGTLAEPAPTAFLVSFGDSAIEYGVRVWTREVRRQSIFRDGVYSRIWYQLRRDGLYIPFPIRTVHLQQEEVRQNEQELVDPKAATLLAKVDLFSDLDSGAQERLARCAARLHYDAGEALVREGDEGDSLFVLETGTVMVNKSGHELGTGAIRLSRLGPGQFFGESSLLTGEQRSATVVAETPVTVLQLSKRALKPFLDDDPSLVETFGRALADRRLEAEEIFEERRRKASEHVADTDTEAGVFDRIRTFFRLSDRR